MKNYYRILGLGIDAEYEEIKAAYRILAQRVHPDKGGTDAEFRLIQEAYEILGNPLTKRVYDQDLLRELREPRIITQTTSSRHGWLLAFAMLAATSGITFAIWSYWQADSSVLNSILDNIYPTKPMVVPHLTQQQKNQEQIKPSTPQKKPELSAQQQAPKNQTEPTSTSTLNGIYFMLNAGSYPTLEEAQQQQKLIQTLGFSNKLQKINANSEGTTSYTIFLGPYKSQNEAQQIQEKLTQQQVEATVQMIDFR